MSNLTIKKVRHVICLYLISLMALRRVSRYKNFSKEDLVSEKEHGRFQTEQRGCRKVACAPPQAYQISISSFFDRPGQNDFLKYCSVASPSGVSPYPSNCNPMITLTLS